MTTQQEIWLLTDYRGAFYSTMRNRWGVCSYDLETVRAEFGKRGFSARILPYSEIDLRRESFKGRLVAYQSAEDPGSRYKDYLEDLLLGIQLQGGVLIPHFACFRAHHNKVFFEVLRDISGDPEIQHPQAWSFGTLEDFRRWRGSYPKVIKRAWGAGSSGVRLARTPVEASRVSRAFSRSAGPMETLREIGRRWLRRKAGYVPGSLHRNKFIVQDFIPGLTSDFKVLVFWDKYYVLCRQNRPGDFRASGSGLFDWPEVAPGRLLDFARRVFDHFDVPVISMDVAMEGDRPALLECQFVAFGPYTMESSNWHFRASRSGWEKVDGPSVPEVEYARSVVRFLQAKGLAQPGT